MSAAERMSATGSVVSRGVGAKAEAAAPKAKAKAAMASMGSRRDGRDRCACNPLRVDA